MKYHYTSKNELSCTSMEDNANQQNQKLRLSVILANRTSISVHEQNLISNFSHPKTGLHYANNRERTNMKIW